MVDIQDFGKIRCFGRRYWRQDICLSTVHDILRLRMLSDSDNPVADGCVSVTQSIYTDMRLNPLRKPRPVSEITPPLHKICSNWCWFDTLQNVFCRIWLICMPTSPATPLRSLVVPFAVSSVSDSVRTKVVPSEESVPYNSKERCVWDCHDLIWSGSLVQWCHNVFATSLWRLEYNDQWSRFFGDFTLGFCMACREHTKL